MRARRLSLLALAAFLPLADVVFARSQPPKPRKVAFLVGVGEFKHGPKALGTAPKRDVTELAKVLEAGGFEVVTLTDGEATKDAIEARYKAVLDGGGNKAKALGNKDVLLVALCSHGFTFEVEHSGVKASEPFVAGHDAQLGDRSTMVSLNGMLKLAEKSAPTTLFLVDACREETDPNRGTRGIEGKRVTLPERTAILFACGAGQLSHQSDNLGGGHGLFTFAVLKALREDRDDVSWTDVVAGVQRSFRSKEFKALIPMGRVQEPVLATGEFGDVQLLARDMAKGGEPKAGEERDFEVADGVKMRFCWIPKGECQLGSPKAERDAVLKLIAKATEPEWLSREAEGVRGKFTSRGFWLGKYEVTQREWTKVTGKPNPSLIVPGHKVMKMAGIEDTSGFPVEKVSWNDITEAFLPVVNSRPGARTAFGKPGKFVLPHEDEWEYACRGGKGNQQAFYWGNELDGQANCIGVYPHNIPFESALLDRTCAVDDPRPSYPKHPWGLCHTLGNVTEWCENNTKQSNNNRMTRGGSWASRASGCRAASQGMGIAPDERSPYLGFRLAFRLDG